MSTSRMTTWLLGEVERARELIDEAIRRAAELGHAPTIGAIRFSADPFSKSCVATPLPR